LSAWAWWKASAQTFCCGVSACLRTPVVVNCAVHSQVFRKRAQPHRRAMGQKASKKAATETSLDKKTPSSTSMKSTSDGPVRGRLSAQFSRLSSKVRGRGAAAAAATAAATSRLQLEQRLSEAIKVSRIGMQPPGGCVPS
jgi:hypothetical protein